MEQNESKEDGLADLLREKTILEEVTHPNVVRLGGFYQDDANRMFWMVLELMEGGELFERIVEKVKPPRRSEALSHGFPCCVPQSPLPTRFRPSPLLIHPSGRTIRVTLRKKLGKLQGFCCTQLDTYMSIR